MNVASEEPCSPRAEVGGRDLAISVAVLFCVAVAVPVFDVLRRNIEFFVVRDAPFIDYLLFALFLGILLPGLLAAVTWSAARLHRGAGLVVQHVLVAVSVASIVFQLLRATDVLAGVTSWVQVPAGLAVGTAIATAVVRSESLRRMLRLGLFVPLLLVGTFLATDPIPGLLLPDNPSSSAAAAVDPNDAHDIVFVVLDEFPVTSLMSSSGEINADRYPNFFRLAERSTWYRNTTAVDPATTRSVPSILTGRRPDPSDLPVLRDHPDTIMSLLGNGPYTVRAHESVTDLCPPDICPRTGPDEPMPTRWRAMASDLTMISGHLLLPEPLTEDLPPIDRGWGGFAGAEQEGEAIHDVLAEALGDDRTESFDRFLASFGDDAPSLDLVHLLLPHSPWIYLPSGHRYEADRRIPGLENGTWTDQGWLVDQAYQRHLLQVGYVDRLLGELLDRLEEQGALDDSILVVTADHGATFSPDTSERALSEVTVGSIAHVPLFIKTVDQHEGAVVDDPVELTDILPTVLDLIGADPGIQLDGMSVVPRPPSDRTRRISTGERTFEIGADDHAYLRSLSSLVDQVPHDGGWERVYTVATQPHLLGQAVRDLDVRGSSSRVVRLDDADALRSVDRNSATLPALLTGRIIDDPPVTTSLDVVIALNGRVVAVTATFNQAKAGMFSALLPPDQLRDGANHLEFFIVEGAQDAFQRIEIEGDDDR